MTLDSRLPRCRSIRVASASNYVPFRATFPFFISSRLSSSNSHDCCDGRQHRQVAEFESCKEYRYSFQNSNSVASFNESLADDSQTTLPGKAIPGCTVFYDHKRTANLVSRIVKLVPADEVAFKNIIRIRRGHLSEDDLEKWRRAVKRNESFQICLDGGSTCFSPSQE